MTTVQRWTGVTVTVAFGVGGMLYLRHLAPEMSTWSFWAPPIGAGAITAVAIALEMWLNRRPAR